MFLPLFLLSFVSVTSSSNLNGDIYNSNKLSNHVYNDSKPNSIKNVNRKKEKRFVPIIRKKMIPGTKR